VRIRAIVLAAALLATVAVATSCGDKGEGASPSEFSKTAGGMTSYVNTELGFSFKIDDRFKHADPDKKPMGGRRPDFEVIYRDPAGTKVGSASVDAFDVSVNTMDQQITPDLLRKKKANIEAGFQDVESQTKDLVWTTPVRVRINGLPGWRIDYTHTAGDTALKERAYALYKGDKQYGLTLQSAASSWSDNAPDLQAAAESFIVE